MSTPNPCIADSHVAIGLVKLSFSTLGTAKRHAVSIFGPSLDLSHVPSFTILKDNELSSP